MTAMLLKENCKVGMEQKPSS